MSSGREPNEFPLESSLVEAGDHSDAESVVFFDGELKRDDNEEPESENTAGREAEAAPRTGLRNLETTNSRPAVQRQTSSTIFLTGDGADVSNSGGYASSSTDIRFLMLKMREQFSREMESLRSSMQQQQDSVSERVKLLERENQNLKAEVESLRTQFDESAGTQKELVVAIDSQALDAAGAAARAYDWRRSIPFVAQWTPSWGEPNHRLYLLPEYLAPLLVLLLRHFESPSVALGLNMVTSLLLLWEPYSKDFDEVMPPTIHNACTLSINSSAIKDEKQKHLYSVALFGDVETLHREVRANDTKKLEEANHDYSSRSSLPMLTEAEASSAALALAAFRHQDAIDVLLLTAVAYKTAVRSIRGHGQLGIQLAISRCNGIFRRKKCRVATKALSELVQCSNSEILGTIVKYTRCSLPNQCEERGRQDWEAALCKCLTLLPPPSRVNAEQRSGDSSKPLPLNLELQKKRRRAEPPKADVANKIRLLLELGVSPTTFFSPLELQKPKSRSHPAGQKPVFSTLHYLIKYRCHPEQIALILDHWNSASGDNSEKSASSATVRTSGGISLNHLSPENDLNDQKTALHYAVESRNLEVLAMFVHQCDHFLYDMQGNLPFHIAVKMKWLEGVKVLLFAKGARNTLDAEVSPLPYVDVRQQTEHRCTPLQIAIKNADLEMMTFLLEEGADVTLLTQSGASCLDYALELTQRKGPLDVVYTVLDSVLHAYASLLPSTESTKLDPAASSSTPPFPELPQDWYYGLSPVPKMPKGSSNKRDDKERHKHFFFYCLNEEKNTPLGVRWEHPLTLRRYLEIDTELAVGKSKEGLEQLAMFREVPDTFSVNSSAQNVLMMKGGFDTNSALADYPKVITTGKGDTFASLYPTEVPQLGSDSSRNPPTAGYILAHCVRLCSHFDWTIHAWLPRSVQEDRESYPSSLFPGGYSLPRAYRVTCIHQTALYFPMELAAPRGYIDSPNLAIPLDTPHLVKHCRGVSPLHSLAWFSRLFDKDKNSSDIEKVRIASKVITEALPTLLLRDKKREATTREQVSFTKGESSEKGKQETESELRLDVNLRNDVYRETALHTLVRRKLYLPARILIEDFGAEYDLIDGENKTVRNWVAEHATDMLLRLFQAQEVQKEWASLTDEHIIETVRSQDEKTLNEAEKDNYCELIRLNAAMKILTKSDPSSVENSSSSEGGCRQS